MKPVQHAHNCRFQSTLISIVVLVTFGLPIYTIICRQYSLYRSKINHLFLGPFLPMSMYLLLGYTLLDPSHLASTLTSEVQE